MARKNEIDFDFDALEAELYSSLAKAFTSLQLDFPDEPFYAFTLYVSENFVYVSIAANTEGGLERTALRYRKEDPDYAKVSIEETEAYFRPHFGDFAFFSGHDMRAYGAMLKGVHTRFGDFNRQCDALNDYYELELNVGWEPAEEILIPLRQRILDICINVMVRLDEAKVFELNNQRYNVTLQIVHGDREPSAETVRRLNPEAVYERYIKEYEEYKAAYLAIHGDYPEWGQ